MEVDKALGMVIGGRAARACDVCGRERARWYCAADAAYLCERCDGSVHGANSVAKRHERVRLGPNGAPVKIERSSSGVMKKDDYSGVASRSFHQGSRKKPRTRRYHSRPAKISTAKPTLAEVKVKTEPLDVDDEVEVPNNHLLDGFLDCKGLHHAIDILHEVPLHTPTGGEQPSFDFGLLPLHEPGSGSPLHVTAKPPAGDVEDQNDESLDFLVPGNSFEIGDFLDSGADLCDFDLDDIARLLGEGHDMRCLDKTGLLGNCHDQAAAKVEDGYAPGILIAGAANDIIANDRAEAGYEVEAYVNGEISPRSWLCKVKVESPPDLGVLTELDADTVLGGKLDGSHIHGNRKLGLRLNYEDVLNAWSDRGSLWMDGHRPPDESSLDLLVGVFLCGAIEMDLVPDLSFNNSCSSQSGEDLGQFPVIQNGITGCSSLKTGAREARVMRYKEKRRTRLFSKKIRYEVRKLNADKRPRMKGRFVKRTPGML